MLSSPIGPVCQVLRLRNALTCLYVSLRRSQTRRGSSNRAVSDLVWISNILFIWVKGFTLPGCSGMMHHQQHNRVNEMTYSTDSDKVAADYLATLSKEELLALLLRSRVLLIEAYLDLEDEIADSTIVEQEVFDRSEATDKLLHELVNEEYEGPSDEFDE